MGNQYFQNQGQRGSRYAWISVCLVGLGLIFFWTTPSGSALAAEDSPKKAENQKVSSMLQLSLDEALSLFLKQNLELLIVKWGIDSAKGRTITAGQIPNRE